MKKLIGLLVLLVAVPAFAQSDIETPKVELFGGYNIAFLDNDGGNLDGWNAAFTGNINPVLGIKAELAGLYGHNKELDSLKYSGFSFMAGPQFSMRGNKVTAFMHTLFGVQHMKSKLELSDMDVSITENAFSAAIGGGFDLHGQRLGWRVVQFDYLPWHNSDGTAHNFRISTGVLARF